MSKLRGISDQVIFFIFLRFTILVNKCHVWTNNVYKIKSYYCIGYQSRCHQSNHATRIRDSGKWESNKNASQTQKAHNAYILYRLPKTAVSTFRIKFLKESPFSARQHFSRVRNEDQDKNNKIAQEVSIQNMTNDNAGYLMYVLYLLNPPFSDF